MSSRAARAAAKTALHQPRKAVLSNGVRVVTYDSGELASCVGVNFLAGSRFEDAFDGRAHIYSKLSLSPGDYRLHDDLSRKIGQLPGLDKKQNIGKSTQEQLLHLHKLGIEQAPVNVTRDMMGTTVGVLRPWAGAAIKPLVDAVVLPGCYDAIINQRVVKEDYLEQLRQLRECDEELQINELAFAAAFNGQGLGRSLYADETTLDQVGHAELQDYKQRLLTPDRMVITGVNVDHDEFVAAAESTLCEYRTRDRGEDLVDASYSPGFRVASGKTPAVSIGFRVPGADSESFAALFVLQLLMGGGSKFSSGGPGKGLCSRLFRLLGESMGRIKHASPVFESTPNEAVLGISLVADPEFAEHGHIDTQGLMELCAVEWMRLKQGVTADEVEMARNMAIGQLQMNYEDRFVIAEDMSRNALLDLPLRTVDEYTAAVADVTADQINGIIANMTQEDPYIAAITPSRSAVPSPDQLVAFLKRMP
ncbi:MAG: hypothetical protein MHM6MM_001033 [Cercozoa sp. M6MM]